MSRESIYYRRKKKTKTQSKPNSPEKLPEHGKTVGSFDDGSIGILERDVHVLSVAVRVVLNDQRHAGWNLANCKEKWKIENEIIFLRNIFII